MCKIFGNLLITKSLITANVCFTVVIFIVKNNPWLEIMPFNKEHLTEKNWSGKSDPAKNLFDKIPKGGNFRS